MANLNPPFVAINKENTRKLKTPFKKNICTLMRANPGVLFCWAEGFLQKELEARLKAGKNMPTLVLFNALRSTPISAAPIYELCHAHGIPVQFYNSKIMRGVWSKQMIKRLGNFPGYVYILADKVDGGEDALAALVTKADRKGLNYQVI